MRLVVDSTKLSQWFTSARRDAQELLPHVVRRLINATVPEGGILQLRIPVGDDIIKRGYDGIVTINTIHRYIPPDKSIWEMGTGDPEAKAEKDYATRTKKLPVDQEGAFTFVFVTPHSWAGKDAWVASKEKEGKWSGVRVIDGVDLEAWLEIAPGVVRWLAGEMGDASVGWSDVDLFRAELDAMYRTVIPNSLIIGGRVAAQSELETWISSENAELEIEGESVEEGAAFVAATMLTLSDERREWLCARTLYVSTPNALDNLSHVTATVFVIPLTVEAARRARATRSKSHRLIIPIVNRPTSLRRVSAGLKLGRIKRQSCEEVLVASGTAKQRAHRIAQDSKGSLTAALWMLARGPDSPLPWTAGKAAADLTPLLLVSQWVPSQAADRMLMEKLTGKPFGEIEEILTTWKSPHGPLIQRSGLWDWVALDYAWECLAVEIRQDLLSRFREAILEVNNTPDPGMELPPEKRWAANLFGKVHPYSAAIRTSLFASLLYLAIHDGNVAGGEAFASDMVGRLLGGKVLPLDKAWYSLAQWLPMLSETSPTEFLTATQAMSHDAALIKTMFTDGGVFQSAPYVYVLWALERLAWSPTYFSRTVAVLGDLAAIDPGGNLSNRPANSLTTMFLPWLPQGRASQKERLAALDVLYAKHPDVAWKVALSLLPGEVQTSSHIAKPYWRDWNTEQEPVTDYWEVISAIVQRLLTWAGVIASRWLSLIETYPALVRGHDQLAETCLAALRAIDVSTIGHAGRLLLAEALQHQISRHREFSDAEWAMKEQDVLALEEVYERFKPTDPKELSKWLFTGWPELAENKDLSYEEQIKLLSEKRRSAVEVIAQSGGVQAVVEFAQMVDSPDTVGWAYAQLDNALLEDVIVLKASLIASPEPNKIPPLLSFGVSYARGRVEREGISWAYNIAEDQRIAWTPSTLSNFAWALPERAATWDWLELKSPEAACLYWIRVPFNFVLEPEKDLQRALEELLEAKRPYRSIRMAGMGLNGPRKLAMSSIISTETVIRMLTEAPKQSHDLEWYSPGLGNIGHQVEQLLGILEDGKVENGVIAGIEWRWMALLEHGQRGLKAIQKELCTSPSLFIDALKLVYRAEGEEPAQISEDEQAHSTQAYRLLSSWKVVPGTEGFVSDTQKHDEDVTFASGTVNRDLLFEWVDTARKLAVESRRLSVCDSQLGQVLAHAPKNADASWPCEPVSELIEKVASKDLERGIQIGVFNKRGVHFRGKGGEQERILVKRFEAYATRARSSWPRTAGMLDEIAKYYDREAKRQDEREYFEEFLSKAIWTIAPAVELVIENTVPKYEQYRQDMVKRLEAGETRKQVASDHGVSVGVVSDAWRSHHSGGDPDGEAPPMPEKPPLLEQYAEQVAAIYHSTGRRFEDIGRELGITRTTAERAHQHWHELYPDQPGDIPHEATCSRCANLSPEMRKRVLSRLQEDRTRAEVAGELGVSETDVRWVQMDWARYNRKKGTPLTHRGCRRWRGKGNCG